MKAKPVREQIRQEPRVGSILLAQPFWNNETYRRAVVLLIDHGIDGSTGIILNKMSNLSLQDALPELNHPVPLFFGGPVNIKTISYVHTNPDIPDAFYIGNNLFWGGNFDYILDQHEARILDLKNFLFCAGVVQWKTGELESEISGNAWWVSEINPAELFSISADELWGQILMGEGHIYGLMNDCPDPSEN